MADRKNFGKFRDLSVDTEVEVAEPGRRLNRREMATLLRRGSNLIGSKLSGYHQQSGTYLDVNKNN